MACQRATEAQAQWDRLGQWKLLRVARANLVPSRATRATRNIDGGS